MNIRLTRALAPLALFVSVSLAACSGGDSLSPDAERGRALFTKQASPTHQACSFCHSLAYDGIKAANEIGRKLDELKPSSSQVEAAVEKGISVMPAFKGVLTDKEIDDVAAYVSEVAGKTQ